MTGHKVVLEPKQAYRLIGPHNVQCNAFYCTTNDTRSMKTKLHLPFLIGDKVNKIYSSNCVRIGGLVLTCNI